MIRSDNPLCLVRLVYIICRDGGDDSTTGWFDDGRFETPESEPEEDSSIDSGCKRISTGALLAQQFFRETVGRTFRLETSATKVPEVIVHRFVLNQRRPEELWNQTPRQLWQTVADQLMNSDLAKDSSHAKYVGFCSFSRFRPDPNRPRWNPADHVAGYVSQGASGLALLSTHCLYTWPESQEQVWGRFCDHRPVPLMDDSNHRGTRGGCFTTTLGAMIHEISHTFNLGHRNIGIMANAFNHIDQFFLSQSNSGSQTEWWTREDLIILQANPWLNDIKFDSTGCHHFKIHRKFLLHSTHVLRLVEYRDPQTNLTFETETFDYNQKIRIYKFRHQNCKVFLLDNRGNTKMLNV